MEFFIREKSTMDTMASGLTASEAAKKWYNWYGGNVGSLNHLVYDENGEAYQVHIREDGVPRLYTHMGDEVK